MSLNNSYGNSLALASAAFASKITVLHVLTVRERFLSSKFVGSKDEQIFFASFFRAFVLAVPGTGLGGPDFIDRAERLAKNCAENEPFFVLMAAIAGLAGAVDLELGTKLVQAYIAARCAHTGIYLLGDKLNTALRSTSFVAGALTTLAFAGSVFAQIVKQK
eukprot:CAMPEP_0197441814 /NCGR_PEP_ID=MMETSP1175-20131217/7979_1 /TAXON_ID=1003142 /ORGANISM="Triceratium dubium, Strain CCMP147" /LENGTH=161 /DNA_ID=CAMNT_0042972149 /DNA_START=145 /DNA_END=630 /DNA_ORIENTATION=+